NHRGQTRRGRAVAQISSPVRAPTADFRDARALFHASTGKICPGADFHNPLIQAGDLVWVEGIDDVAIAQLPIDAGAPAGSRSPGCDGALGVPACFDGGDAVKG